MPIKKGDQLILTQDGEEVPVEAMDEEHDGTVKVLAYGVYWTVNVPEVRPAKDVAKKGTRKGD